MSTNFSKPMSAPKPLSVTIQSPSLRPSRSATSELLPCAMLANGPQWTSAGWPSSVCTRFGFSASLSSTVIEPAAPICSAVTGSPSKVEPTVIAPRRARRSARSRATATIAITSEAAVMSKPVSRGMPFARPPSPTTVWRSTRSSMSTQRRQVIECGSSPSSLPCRRCESIIAASRLLAAPIAWMSPVKWRLISSIGTTWARPPPVPPPLSPKTGPSDGSRRQSTGLSPIAPSPWVSEIEVVVLPSPNRVGVIDVTDTILPSGAPASRSIAESSIFAAARAVRQHLVGLEPERIGELGDHRRIL